MRRNKDVKETTRRLIKAGIAVGILGGGASMHMDAFAADITEEKADESEDTQAVDETKAAEKVKTSNEQAGVALGELSKVWNEVKDEETGKVTSTTGAMAEAVTEVNGALNMTDDLTDLANKVRYNSGDNTAAGTTENGNVSGEVANGAAESENVAEEPGSASGESGSAAVEDGSASEEAGNDASATTEAKKELKPSETIKAIDEQLGTVIKAPTEKTKSENAGGNTDEKAEVSEEEQAVVADENTEVSEGDQNANADETAGVAEEEQLANADENAGVSDEKLSLDTTGIEKDVETVLSNLEMIKNDTTLSDLSDTADGLVLQATGIIANANEALAKEDLNNAEKSVKELAEVSTELENTLKAYKKTLSDLKQAKADALEAADDVYQYLDQKIGELEKLYNDVKTAQDSYVANTEEIKAVEGKITSKTWFEGSFKSGVPFDLTNASGTKTYSDCFIEFLRSYIAKEVFDGAEVESITCCRWSEEVNINGVNRKGGDVLNYYEVKISGIDEPLYFNYKIADANNTNNYSGMVIFEKVSHDVAVKGKNRNDTSEEEATGIDYRNDNWYTGDVVFSTSKAGENYAYHTDGLEGNTSKTEDRPVITGDTRFDGVAISEYYGKGAKKYDDTLTAIENALKKMKTAYTAVGTLKTEIENIQFTDKNATVENMSVKVETTGKDLEELQDKVSDLRGDDAESEGGASTSDDDDVLTSGEAAQEEGGSVLGANRVLDETPVEPVQEEGGSVLGAERGRGKSPKTGDASNALGAVATMGTSLIGAASMLGLRRRNK